MDKVKPIIEFNTIYIMLPFFLTIIPFMAFGQRVNYNEAMVPNYTLPDPLVFPNGKKVTTPKEWKNKRRPQILHLFETQVYGKSPKPPKAMHFKVTSIDTSVFDGKATRKQVSIYFKAHNRRPRIDLLIYIPNNQPKPVPAFMGMNFFGNQTIYPDPGIKITDQWVMNRNFGTHNNQVISIRNHHATEKTRGVYQGRWPVEAILNRGYALVTFYYGDLEPDYDNYQNGIQPLYYKEGQTRPAPDQWGAISVWAWSLSRAEDYLEKSKDIDASRVAIFGFSRLGKAALWAGAQDQRFAFVISNESGCGGAALSRRKYGETVKSINTHFPWWFCKNFHQYSGKVDSLPVDQHELIALIAPRPVYVASAKGDPWSDPKGEFLACKYASPVYKLLGVKGLVTNHMPGLDQPTMGGHIAYHIRPGYHNITLYDWGRYMDFVDKFLK
jgi:hypothetical protein